MGVKHFRIKTNAIVLCEVTPKHKCSLGFKYKKQLFEVFNKKQSVHVVKQTKMICNKCELFFVSFKVHIKLVEEPKALCIVEFKQPFVELALFVATLES